MSKFIDELNKSHRSVAPSMGFRKDADVSKKPPLLLIADLTAKTVKEIKATIEAGVDAVILRGTGLKADAMQKLIKNAGKVPAGLVVDDDNWGNYTGFFKEGCDFVVCDAKAPVSVLTGDELGRILRIESSLAPGMIRAINELNPSVDSVLVDSEDTTITIERMLVSHYISGIIGKPLLVTVGTPLTTADLQGLYEAGVRGLLLQKGISVKALSELKQQIDNMPRTIRKKQQGSVTLPQLKRETEIEMDEEEDDI
jgi:hypothetical protein